MDGSNDGRAGRTSRTRSWGGGIVVVALVGLVLAVTGGSSAGALDPSDCVGTSNPGNTGDNELVANDDGDRFGLDYSTTWNVPLIVDTPSVLANDTYGTVWELPADRLRAILWSQTTYGTVQLHSDGTWVYTPAVEHPQEHVIETFQYVAYDPTNGICSVAPATVTFSVGGYTEVLGRAPTAFTDRFPTDGSALAANEVLEIPAPGVLANDFNNDEFPYQANSNLVAGLVSQPVWEGTTDPAGVVTEWGKRTDQGVTVFDNSGGFTYTAPPKGHGTAVFSYVACYAMRSTTATACSQPQVARIDVEPTAVARPITTVLKTWVNGRVNAQLMPAHFEPHVDFNSPARTWFPRFGTPAQGTLEVGYFPYDVGEHRTGDFLAVIYTPGPGFAGSDQFSYRLCDTLEDTPTTVCTNDSTITVTDVAPSPKVTSMTQPSAEDGSLVLDLDQDVRGITTDNIRLAAYVGTSLSPVAVELRCTSRLLPGTSPYFCEGNYGDTIHVRPVGGWSVGTDYHLRVNMDDRTGIVAAGDPQAQPLEGYIRTFRFQPSGVDLLPPVAAPTTSQNPDGSITVTWNWSDAGVGIDPEACPATSTSSGPEPQTLAGQCFDLGGRIGWSAVAVEPQAPTDTAPPVASPTLSPAPTGDWSTAPVTVTWHWSDGDGAGIDPARCTTSSTSSGEGFMVLAASCTDLAGNTGLGQQSLRIDLTAPALAPTIAPNRVLFGGTGTATPNATDAVSGVATASCGAVATRTLGARRVLCTATDRAGHTELVSVPYTVGARVDWIARPDTIWSESGSVAVVVQLKDADGRAIPDSVARRLPTCSVTFTLGDQRPVCAVYLAEGMFIANVASRQRLTPGAAIPLTSKVTLDGTEIGTTSTSVVVK